MTPRSWRDADPALVETLLSKRELHLIQRLRQLRSGLHAVLVTKVDRGRDGLRSFTVQETLAVPTTEEDSS